jgi:hypothetical protein
MNAVFGQQRQRCSDSGSGRPGGAIVEPPLLLRIVLEPAEEKAKPRCSDAIEQLFSHRHLVLYRSQSPLLSAIVVRRHRQLSRACVVTASVVLY